MQRKMERLVLSARRHAARSDVSSGSLFVVTERPAGSVVGELHPGGAAAVQPSRVTVVARGEVRVLLLRHEAAAASSYCHNEPLLMARLASAQAQLSAQAAIEQFAQVDELADADSR